MQGQKLIQNCDDFPNTHYFVYKNKQFPIKFDFFRISSKQFANNQINIDQNQNIHLVVDESEKNLNLSDKSIQSFIKYIQHQDTFLNKDNVSGINYLAKKYEVLSLIKATEEYINEHHSELILPSFLIYQNDPSFDTSHYETILANNLEQYLNDDRLPTLKISILYRVFEKYSKSGENKNGYNDKLFDFLFKCLDEHKKEASVLFSFVDIENSRSGHLIRLLKNYGDVFDFHFINSSLVKTVYDIQSEMILNEKKNEMKNSEVLNTVENEIKKMKEEVKKVNELNTKLVDEIKRKDEQIESKIKLLTDEISKLKKDKEMELNENVKKETKNLSEIQKLKDEVNKLKQFNDKQLDDQKKKEKENDGQIRKLKDEVNELKKFNDKLLDEQKKKDERNSIEIEKLKNENKKLTDNPTNKQNKSVDVPFVGDQFNGIITKLGNGNPKNVINEKIVDITGSSTYDNMECRLPHHVVEYDSDGYFYSKDVKDSWIKFDFKNKKVKLSHYSIKTNQFGDVGHAHIQNWCIEGSNNDSNWKPLDTHTNDKTLDHQSASNTFQIKNASNNDYYRYIRLRQTDVNTHGSHEILLASIEYFGSIIDC